jgi:hypothetical protein
MTIDGTTRILLERYQPDSPLLRVPVSAVKSEVSRGGGQSTNVASVSSQEVVFKSNGRTAVMTVLMSAEKHSDAEITAACTAFNKLNPKTMSQSYQLPVEFEGIASGSWVFISYPEGQ